MENLFVPLLLIGIIVAFIWLLRWLARGGKKIAAEQAARFANGRPARVEVIQVGKSAPQVRNGTVIVKLRLKVTPQDGGPYEVSEIWNVQSAQMGRVQPGQSLAARIDADDPQKVYPAEGWAAWSALYRDAWLK